MTQLSNVVLCRAFCYCLHMWIDKLQNEQELNVETLGNVKLKHICQQTPRKVAIVPLLTIASKPASVKTPNNDNVVDCMNVSTCSLSQWKIKTIVYWYTIEYISLWQSGSLWYSFLFSWFWNINVFIYNRRSAEAVNNLHSVLDGMWAESPDVEHVGLSVVRACYVFIPL